MGTQYGRGLQATEQTRYLRETAPRQSAREGLNARRILARLQLGGELFLLTFPFIEPKGRKFEIVRRGKYFPIRTLCTRG
jgi:hypothetical protein